jgi:hypothetical protein
VNQPPTVDDIENACDTESPVVAATARRLLARRRPINAVPDRMRHCYPLENISFWSKLDMPLALHHTIQGPAEMMPT